MESYKELYKELYEDILNTAKEVAEFPVYNKPPHLFYHKVVRLLDVIFENVGENDRNISPSSYNFYNWFKR
jgi:hypothetical protein